ncbi:MAG: hypothetical protein NWE89_04910 [Candidatus Bathyarchaeota archaeon]|nr:hypothetical protein [Candidatus Bathyarchaeota archaeon]
MYGDRSSEIVHCPNCKEDVPKTLYCLNCGYPLYKIEQETPVEEVQPEPEVIEVETPEEPVVDMSVEIEQPEEVIIEEPEEEPEIDASVEVEETEVEIEVDFEPEEEPVAIEEEPVLEAEPIHEEPEIEAPEDEPEPIVEDEPEAEIVPEVEEEPEVEVEEIPEEPVEEEPIYEEPEPEPVVIEEPVLEPTVEPVEDPYKIEMEPEEMDEIRIEFAPDPLTKEVMENLAKNITLKIRLVRLLRDGQVKEETFKKLFDSYVDQGRLWVSRRDEIIRRFKSDIERMDESLVTARKDFELLDIRKSIGDAAPEEYSVKAPAYNWDIEHLETEIKNRKGGVLYVANLRKLCPEDEVVELQRLADNDYSELDTVESISSDTIAKMKETLAEALNSLQS